jgi:hypothetical protein
MRSRDGTTWLIHTTRIARIAGTGLRFALIAGTGLGVALIAALAPVAPPASADVFEIADSSQARSAPPGIPVSVEPAPSVATPAPGRSIGAFMQRVPDDLRSGPGFGLGCACEGRSMAFPTLLADWRPIDDLAFTAGRELGSSTGPGIYTTWTFSRLSDLTLGFRFERTRFRLAPQPGFELGRMGEDQSLPAFAALRFGPAHAFVALIAGAELRGRVRIEDETGGFIAERDERPAPFVAVAGRMRF